MSRGLRTSKFPCTFTACRGSHTTPYGLQLQNQSEILMFPCWSCRACSGYRAYKQTKEGLREHLWEELLSMLDRRGRRWAWSFTSTSVTPRRMFAFIPVTLDLIPLAPQQTHFYFGNLQTYRKVEGKVEETSLYPSPIILQHFFS